MVHMKQVLIRQGKAIVEDVPAPVCEAGRLLAQVRQSCISVGTEMSGVKASGTPLWQRVVRQPHRVKQVLELASKQGLARTGSLVKGKLTAATPTGYSAAGTVIEVGKGVEGFEVGDRVACAGARFAYHAEIICVPPNLAVPIPEGVDFPAASTVTLGAIAMQGVRRASPTLGETFVVIGLGILGQLTVQLLRANGCRVIGTDMDPGSIEKAKELGMDLALAGDEGDVAQTARLTDGVGADGVIITAATSSDEVASSAFQMCRKKGRVVLVGDVGLDLNREDFYKKELDFLVSTSYGPGRYDRNYEEEGLDYPVSHVRWTENRNMAEYLRLVDEGRVDIESLVEFSYPVDRAGEAYESLEQPDGPRPLLVLLSYGEREVPRERRIPNPKARGGGKGAVRVALVGAGAFAQATHLPNLSRLRSVFHLRAVVDSSGPVAAAATKQFGAEYSATDYRQVLDDKDIDAVLICTRHNLHASMVSDALEAGKHVFVEKPLALTADELGRISGFYAGKDAGTWGPVLLTGFNRRFSPFAQRIRGLMRDRSNPAIMVYRMNAGHMPADNWVHGKEGGGRNLGEACHIYDLFTFLTGAKMVDIDAKSIRPATDYYGRTDNFVATLTFDDGSVGTLTYTALGNSGYPKEQMEVFVDGKVIELRDYRELLVHGSDVEGLRTKTQQKGHDEELAAFGNTIRKGGDWPIPLWEQVQATEVALQVETAIAKVETSGGMV